MISRIAILCALLASPVAACDLTKGSDHAAEQTVGEAAGQAAVMTAPVPSFKIDLFGWSGLAKSGTTGAEAKSDAGEEDPAKGDGGTSVEAAPLSCVIHTAVDGRMKTLEAHLTGGSKGYAGTATFVLESGTSNKIRLSQSRDITVGSGERTQIGQHRLGGDAARAIRPMVLLDGKEIACPQK